LVDSIADRQHRAMAGLSMGGGQTFQITQKHLDLFICIGGFSVSMDLGGQPFDGKTAGGGVLADPAVPQRTDGSRYQVAHHWLTWRRSLNEFAPLSFRD
jgi:hypothetical protein